MNARNQDSDRAAAIGHEIAYWRRARGLSRAELGEQAGVSATTIGRYERGNSSPDMTETWKIADVLGVGFTDLVRRAEEGFTIASKPDGEPGAAALGHDSVMETGGGLDLEVPTPESDVIPKRDSGPER